MDLHTHSYFSDGECSPEAVVLQAKKQDISVLSVTDHNVIGYRKEIQETAGKQRIVFIEGIEISTLHQLNNSVSLHVLGYSKNFNRPLLQEALLGTINSYNERARKIIDKLNQEFPGIQLDFEKIKKDGHESYVSRNTLARLLVEHVRNISIEDALKKYVFVAEDDSWMIKTEDSFNLIKQAGGVAVLAHSGRELRRMGLAAYENMIARFAIQGLQGLEVYYPKCAQEEIRIMKEVAKKYQLYITGGSDWHGPAYTPSITMGIEDSKMGIAQFLNEAIGIYL